MFSRYKIIIILFTLIIISFVLFLLLRHKSPDEGKFVEVYVQLSIAQMKFLDDPEKLAAEKKKIFSEYKYSQKELDRFIKFYQKHPEKWVNLWEKINQRLSELIEREKTQPSR